MGLLSPTRYPADKIAVAFNFTIQFEDGNEEYAGVKLNRYGLQESSGRIASFSLRLPVQGSYILFIYAKEDTPENKDNVYAQVPQISIFLLSGFNKRFYFAPKVEEDFDELQPVVELKQVQPPPHADTFMVWVVATQYSQKWLSKIFLCDLNFFFSSFAYHFS